MVTQCPHKRLHGVEPGTHGAGAPLVEKPSCPPGRCVVPEVVERLLQKIGANGAEVVLQDVGKLEGLALREVLFTFEKAPTAVLERVWISLGLRTERHDFLTITAREVCPEPRQSIALVEGA